MKKGDIIRGYKILQDFIVIGGQSKISFAEKGGNEFFIKEFLSPKFPVTGSPGSDEVKQIKKRKCEVFEKHHRTINSKISEKVTLGGNLIFAVDFFRKGTTYFKINERIDVSTITIEKIAELPLEKKILICKTICHSLKILHSLKIVHGDIKPDNVLIKKTKTENFTSKLIDFDNSYFSSAPPENEEDVVGDQVYYAPEMAKYILKLEAISPKDLTLKADIFALGVLFTEYLIGKLPNFSSKYNYAWETLLNGDHLSTSYLEFLPISLSTLLEKMLNVDYKKRPSIDEVFSSLKNYKKEAISFKSIRVDEPKATKKKTESGSLQGTLLKNLKKPEETLPKATLKGSLIEQKKVNK